MYAWKNKYLVFLILGWIVAMPHFIEILRREQHDLSILLPVVLLTVFYIQKVRKRWNTPIEERDLYHGKRT